MQYPKTSSKATLRPAPIRPAKATTEAAARPFNTTFVGSDWEDTGQTVRHPLTMTTFGEDPLVRRKTDGQYAMLCAGVFYAVPKECAVAALAAGDGV